MRRAVTACSVLAALAVAAPLWAQQQQAKEKDPTSAVTAAPLPDGWSMRLDDKDMTKAAKFVTMGSGFHVTSGGAAIYWQPKDEQKDDYTVSATFGQRAKNVGHGDLGEAYGLFVGGRDLSDASKQTYLYFEVRQGGQLSSTTAPGQRSTRLWIGRPRRAFTSSTTRPIRTRSQSRSRLIRCASS